MTLPETFQADRRETATDVRGIPRSYTRAMKGLDGECAHCIQRAVVANGAGVALCQQHRQMRIDAKARLDRAQQRLEAAKRG